MKFPRAGRRADTVDQNARKRSSDDLSGTTTANVATSPSADPSGPTWLHAAKLSPDTILNMCENWEDEAIIRASDTPRMDDSRWEDLCETIRVLAAERGLDVRPLLEFQHACPGWGMPADPNALDLAGPAHVVVAAVADSARAQISQRLARARDAGQPSSPKTVAAVGRTGQEAGAAGALQRLVAELEDYLDNEYSDGSADAFDRIDANHPVHKAVCGVQSECYDEHPLPALPRETWIKLQRWSQKDEGGLSKPESEERRDNIRQNAADLLEWAKRLIDQAAMHASANVGGPEMFGSLGDKTTITSHATAEWLPTPSPDNVEGLRRAAEYCRAKAVRIEDASAPWWWIHANVYDDAAAKAEAQRVRAADGSPGVGPCTQPGEAEYEPRRPRNPLLHALVVAHSSLTATLDEAIDLYNRTVRFPNPSAVIDAIERFVHVLRLVPKWFVELKRRAALVERACAKGSDYDQARGIALSSYTATPQALCRGKLAIKRLRSARTGFPVFLAEVIETTQDIDGVLEEPSLDLTRAAREAFSGWQHECRKVQREAQRLEVDGCWYLYHVYLAADPRCSEASRAAKGIMQTEMGGVNLQPIQVAADSLVAGIRENPIITAETADPAYLEYVARDNAGDGQSDQAVEISPLELSDTKRLILRAILELNAVSESSRVSCPQIGAKVNMGPDARLRSELADLRTLRLLGGKKGQRGYWLTEPGIREARAA